MFRLITSVCMSLAATVAPSFAAQTYGLVIGVDEYTHISDLDGAVNDANDIADALTGIGAEVTTLLNGDASREAVLSTWRSLANQMNTGDQLIVSYAGHGSNEPEHYEGNEEDGRDETLLLSGYSPFGEAAGERIRDDEIAELIALVPAANVIFVADACFSGTVTRTINPVLGYRYVSVGKMTNDPLPPPPPNTAANDGTESIELFLAAVDESNRVPEFMIDGEPRGALSYAFAAGLRGAADMDADQVLTKGEIEQFVRRKVRGISQGVQSPQITHSGASNDVVISLTASSTQELPDPLPQNISPVANVNFDELAPVSIVVEAGSVPLTVSIDGLTVGNNDKLTSLRIDTGTGEIRTLVGDIVASVGPATAVDFQERLAAVVDKTRLALVLESIADDSRLGIHFEDGDRNYFQGDTVTVQVSGRRAPYITLFNIGSDGQIAYLYPLNVAGTQLTDPMKISPADQLNLGLEISAPFGADHVVAIETDADPAILRRVLSSYDGSTDTRKFWDQLRGVLDQTDGQMNLALFPFHSIER